MENDKNIKDADYQHIAIIREKDDFEGGTFEYEYLEEPRGVSIRKGTVIDGSLSYKEPQAYFFGIYQFTEKQAKRYIENEGLKILRFIKAKKKVEDSKKETKNEGDEMINKSILFLDVFDETKLLLTDKATKTPEGFLKTRAIVTNTGIFNYVTEDGTISRQLRDSDEVFNEESLDSLKNKPLTMGHPKELVDIETMKDLQKKGIIIGFTGSDVRRDGHAVSVDLTFTNKDAIDSIDSGMTRALSCGYRADLDYNKEGFAFGNNRYNAQQKDIRYNHVALVERGRAGDLAQIITDNDDFYKIADNIAIQYIEEKNDIKEVNNMSEKKDTNTATIATNDNIITTTLKMDGVDRVIDIDKDVAKHISLLVDENKTLVKNLSDAEGQRDAFKNEVDSLKAKANENKLDEAEIQKRVIERTELVKLADHLKVEYKEDTPNKELKLAIIKAKSEKADMTGKDDNYIDAYFDSIKNMLVDDMANDNTDENKKKVFSRNTDNTNETVKTKDEMYQEYCKKVAKDAANYDGGASIVDGKVIIK